MGWFTLVKIPTEKSPGMRLRMNFLSRDAFRWVSKVDPLREP